MTKCQNISNLQDKAGSPRDHCFWFCCCNVLWDRAVVLRSPEDSNDLWDTCLLLSHHPLEWLTKLQRGNSTRHGTGLMQHPFQGMRSRSLVLYEIEGGKKIKNLCFIQ